MADDILRATVAELRVGSASAWPDQGQEMVSFVHEDDEMSPYFADEAADATQVCEQLMRTLTPASLPFQTRLAQAVPACVEQPDWSQLAAVESTEALRQDEACMAKVEINSGGQVFFVLLKSKSQPDAEEAVVIKFCNNRYMLQSEQMAAELARHFDIPGPASRVLLKAHDGKEWQQLADAASDICPDLAEMLQKKQSMLLLQFVPGENLEKETDAFKPERLANSCRALGRLWVLDLLLGNLDRLPVKSLNWRGNPGNVLWHSDSESSRCVPIDAAVARRPPRLLVQDMDQKAACQLELVLLDRASCQEILLETVSCNQAAVAAIEADWAPNEAAWASRHGGKTEAEALGAVSAAKAFNEGAKSALALALQEQGLLEMIADVVESWLTNFKADMRQVAGFKAPPELKLGETKELQEISRPKDKNESVQERLASWQDLIRIKTEALGKAAEDWASRRGLQSTLSFRGFLGKSVLNPVPDAYELLVRLKQLTSRLKVLRHAGSVHRPADLAPNAPLLVGGATSLCMHLLRKLGVTDVMNCTQDLPEPSVEELGNIRWHRLALADVESQDLNAAFQKALEILRKVKSEGGKTLIHCHEGKSRSVSVCVAYLMCENQMTLAESLAFVKSKRPVSKPNAGFLRQLLELELATLGSNSLSPEDLPKGKPVLSSAMEKRKAGC
eukprot:TRINITY_DN56892_c0_g1_i1.p1 TRINITY_DN56892_c0_g1~~TRINITY_DN56892_c0_g1_i1.p1  ORF type:complete len:693 (-),score=150.86 TRINITY_DN56892_c0_g1_i1:130-2157(-)